jgi:N-dimethylarginine dimethylaminohydrolase
MFFYRYMYTKPTIYVCPPSSFTLAYEINRWMDTTNQINTDTATQQWETLCNTLTQAGANVISIAGDQYPDSVFIANAGLLIDDTFILSRFRFPERQREESVWRELFEAQGYTVIQPPEHHYFEGAGDALFFRGHLIGGTGFRGTKNTYNWIEKILHTPTLTVELVDPHFYHLDTCFCPLDDNTALIYRGAFSQKSFDDIAHLGGKLIEVSKEDAHRFACNAATVGTQVVLPHNNPDTETKLKESGYAPLPIAMDEFIKSGGAAKCCTLTPTTFTEATDR